MHSAHISIAATTIFASVLPSAMSARAAESDCVAHWQFEQAEDGYVSDRISGTRDGIAGNYRLAEGVVDRALKCDGFTTCITRKAQTAPKLGSTFTIESWVAVQAYPWGWCPIVSQRDGRTAGYLFGVDARGRLGLHVTLRVRK